MAVHINWPIINTTIRRVPHEGILVSVLSDMSLKDMALTGSLTRSDKSVHAITGQFVQVIRVAGRDLWLFDVCLPLDHKVAAQAQCYLTAKWTDDHDKKGVDETIFQVDTLDTPAGVIHPYVTNITSPKNGDEIPTSYFVAGGKEDHALIASADGSCTYGYPCLLDLSTSPPTAIEFTRCVQISQTWTATWPSVPPKSTFSLTVRDIYHNGQTITGLWTA